MQLRYTLHAHHCPRCGNRWEHHPADFHSREEFNAGHACPACGYNGDECRDPYPPARMLSPVEDLLRGVGL